MTGGTYSLKNGIGVSFIATGTATGLAESDEFFVSLIVRIGLKMIYDHNRQPQTN
jgi:hypothetical protein